jgi:hypothetical protein
MEQRQSPRFPVRFRSSFTSLNIVGGDGSIVDLSLRGCREVRILISEEEPPLQIQEAVVRWSRAHQFGLEFVTLAPEEWARLQHSVTQLELHPYEKEQPDDSPEAA